MSKVKPINKTPKDPITQLISVIEENMADFPNSEEYRIILKKKKNENQHSDAFCLFMQRKCNYIFQFTRELSQFGTSSIDMGIRHNCIVIFTIEAKVFPTPLTSKDRKEHEYVYGQKGGGIQRFKEENHGLDDENNLIVQNGMIAYIKKNTFDYWFTKVNQWIKDAKWEESESLLPKYSEEEDKYKSQHPRKNGTNVILHHFWINVSTKP